MGWKIDGTLPDDPKQVIIVAPHTSNWDFVVGILCVFALGLQVNWIGKKALFRGMLGTLLVSLGGIPVDRARPGTLVSDMVAEFARRDRLLLCLTPEGTRRPVEQWKNGYVRIARGAGVPIVPAYLDFRKKTAGFFPPLDPADDIGHQQEHLRSLYRQVTPKNPANFIQEFTL